MFKVPPKTLYIIYVIFDRHVIGTFYYLAEKHAEKITWLKLNNEPWDQVLTYWTSTYELRKDVTYDTVTDFINDWPILNDVRGEVLVRMLSILINFL